MSNSLDTFTLADMFPDMPNAFTDDYVKAQVAWYGAPKELEHVGNTKVHIINRALMGRVDDYLNVQFRIDKDMVVPIFTIDGATWMSLTPMEIQSAALPIYQAWGSVATSGLGMGYFALQAARNDKVDFVDVYERDAAVIEVFDKLHGSRWEYEKINIIHGDVRELMMNKEYDFVFMDTYKSMLDEEALTDIALFNDNNDIEEYCFWGQEKLMLEAWQQGLITVGHLPYAVRYFIWMWSESEGARLKGTGGPDEEYLEQGILAMTEYGIM